jgi:DNA repair exonuclease SbcCD nuclease subunit
MPSPQINDCKSLICRIRSAVARMRSAGCGRPDADLRGPSALEKSRTGFFSDLLGSAAAVPVRRSDQPGRNPGSMVKILHTADWQLGLRLNFVGGDAAVRLRSQRFATIEAIAALAREQQVDAVVVAGDVFDDNGVGRDTLQQARDALRSFGEIPVVLLPGNHDPATEDSALARLGELGDHLHAALTPEPVRLGELEIHPCPLLRRHQYDDPTGVLTERGDSRAIRVALAHGGVLDFGEETETPNRIDPDAVIAKGFDYLALGDWHAVYQVGDRAWYSGAHEATRFKEKRPGRVLLVEIEGPGALPRIEEHQVARTHWHRVQFEFSGDEDLARLEQWFADLERPSDALAAIELDGVLSLAGRSRLDDLLEDYAARLALLRIEADRIQAAPTEEDLETLRGEGFVARALATLREEEDPRDTDALRLMHRLMTEEAR